MKFLVLLAFVAISVQATIVKIESHPGFEPLSIDHVNHINSLNTTWTAQKNFNGLKIEDVKKLCGTILDQDKEQLKQLSPPNPDNDDIEAYKLPEEFDSRKQWPECANVINHIRDQGSCGSCWAVAAASAITDRVCIASKGEKQAHLSAQILTSCCMNCTPKDRPGDGCKGGYIMNAWLYWLRTGIPSGGDYGDKKTCAPYLISPCEHHTEGPRPKCGELVPTPKCSTVCTNTGFNFKQDTNQGKIAFQSNPWPSEIKVEIMKRGPVEAGFEVYDDFLLYKDGIYKTTPTAKLVGGHAVVLIGWGQENGVKYWLAKNSWNTDWGKLGGLFKIEERTAKIIDQVVSGIARTPKKPRE